MVGWACVSMQLAFFICPSPAHSPLGATIGAHHCTYTPRREKTASTFKTLQIYTYIYMYSVLSLHLILNIQYTILMGSPVASKGTAVGNIAIKLVGAAGHRAPGCCSLWGVPTVPEHWKPQTAWQGQILPAPVWLESNGTACWYLLLEKYLIVKLWFLSENNKKVCDFIIFF